MARGNRPVEVRVDDATRDRWAAAARDSGQTLAAFIRDTVEAAVGGLVRPQMNPDLVGAKMTAKGKGKTPFTPVPSAPCPRETHHRSGTFCKACGTMPQ